MKATVVIATTLSAVILLGSVSSIERHMNDDGHLKLSATQGHAISEERLQELITKMKAGADSKSTQSISP